VVTPPTLEYNFRIVNDRFFEFCNSSSENKIRICGHSNDLNKRTIQPRTQRKCFPYSLSGKQNALGKFWGSIWCFQLVEADSVTAGICGPTRKGTFCISAFVNAHIKKWTGTKTKSKGVSPPPHLRFQNFPYSENMEICSEIRTRNDQKIRRNRNQSDFVTLQSIKPDMRFVSRKLNPIFRSTKFQFNVQPLSSAYMKYCNRMARTTKQLRRMRLTNQVLKKNI
jgi:hypothetical protein